MIRANNDLASLREFIGKRLSTIRQHRGLHQSEFAESLGISPRSYQNYELGIRELPSSVIWHLVDKYQIDAQWLLTGEAGMYYHSPSQLAKASLEKITHEANELGLNPSLGKLPDILAIVVEQTISMRSMNTDEIKSLIRLACDE